MEKSIPQRKRKLLRKLTEITKEKISETEAFIASRLSGLSDSLIISMEYDTKEFWFRPKVFVFVPDGRLALCLGVNVVPEDCDPRGINLWFLVEEDEDLSFWAYNRKDDFIAQGFEPFLE